MATWRGRAWITGTSSLIAFIAFSPQLTGLFEGAPTWQLVLFNGLVALIYLNYACAVRTDPGSVPPEWTPPEDTTEIRFCKKCEVTKPPRAHHCRYCKRCILRYDHHCPWVNNCIGLYNYPYFIRFLFYVDLACSMHLYLVSTCAFSPEYLSKEVSNFDIVVLVANYVLCIPVLIAVGLFSLYHFWNMAVNTTTIEGSEKDRVVKMVRRGKIAHTPFPFHVGLTENIHYILGHSPLQWCLWGRGEGDGLSYPAVVGSDPLRWPPRDPYDYLKQNWQREADVRISQVPPYHPDYQSLTAVDDEDEDVPLAELQKRSVRLRKGSEGFEVRPVARYTISDSEEESSDTPSKQEFGSDWEELYDRKYALYDSESNDDDY